MLSDDKNIETIAQLVEKLREYAQLKTEYLKLDFIEKTVKLFTAIFMIVVLSIILLLSLTYFSFAIAYALANVIGYPQAFCVVGGVYIVVFIVVICKRKNWIERPLVRFLATLLME